MADFNTFRLAKRLLTCARSLVAANLNQMQRDMIDKFLKKRRDGMDFGDVIPWNPDGRAYFPARRAISDIQAPFEIVHALRLLGYSISSYRDGYAVKTIEVRDGKKTQRKGIGKILKNEVHDESLYKWFMNRLGTSNKSDKRQFLVCITHNAEDVGAMSTGRNWTSCMHLPEDEHDVGGAFYDTALRQVQYGGLCAYLIDPEDKSVDRPYARIAIKRLESQNGANFIYKAENRVYGDEELAEECGMEEIVDRELKKSNEKTRIGGGVRFTKADPDAYSDSGISTVYFIDNPSDVLELTEDEFKKYVFSKQNILKLDDLYLKSIMAYISMHGFRKGKANDYLCYIYRSIKPDNRLKFLEYFIEFIDFRLFSMTRELPVEFMARHPDKIHWPSIVSHCGAVKDKFTDMWYSYDELEPFADRVEKARAAIEDGRSDLNETAMRDLVEKTIRTINDSRSRFMDEFHVNYDDISNLNGLILSGLELSSVTSLQYIIDHGGPDEMFGNAIKIEKKDAAHFLKEYFKDDKKLNEKDNYEICLMAEHGRLSKEQADQYEALLRRGLSRETYRLSIHLEIEFDQRNATMSFSYRAYSSFKETEDGSRLEGEKQTFDIGEDIMASISETVKKTLDWMAKP